VETVRRFTHPLTGDVHEQRASAAPRQRRGGVDLRALVPVLVALLAVAAVVAGSYAYRFYARWSQAAAAIQAAQGKIEYEPLSTVKDGSYEESDGGEGSGRAMRVLRRLRRR